MQEQPLSTCCARWRVIAVGKIITLRSLRIPLDSRLRLNFRWKSSTATNGTFQTAHSVRRWSWTVRNTSSPLMHLKRWSVELLQTSNAKSKFQRLMTFWCNIFLLINSDSREYLTATSIIYNHIQSIAILDILENHRQSKFETALSNNFKI